MQGTGCLCGQDCSSNTETHDAVDSLLTSPLGGSRRQDFLKPRKLFRYNWPSSWFRNTWHSPYSLWWIYLFNKTFKGSFWTYHALRERKSTEKSPSSLPCKWLTSRDSPGVFVKWDVREKQTRQSCWEGGSTPAAAHDIISYNNLAKQVNHGTPEVLNHSSSVARFHWKVIGKPLK